MKKIEEVIMVDMDGTLSYSSWRNKWAPSNGGTWETFHQRCDEDNPTELVPVIRELSKIYTIAISTARPFYVIDKTHCWLKEQGLKVGYYLCRTKENMNLSSVQLKMDHIDALRNVKKLKIKMMIDDKQAVCDAFMNKGIPAWLVDFQGKDVVTDPKPKLTVFTNTKSPYEILNESAEFFIERNKEYGNAWTRHGEIMQSMFPDGITLETEKDFFMYHCIVMDVVKTTRICNAMANGNDHEDSWKDKIVFSAMAKSQIMED